MAQRIHIGDVSVRITAEPLTSEVFAPFGDAIYPTRPDVHPSSFHAHAASMPPNASSANQGSAIRYAGVSRPRNLYHLAPSQRGEPVMSVFSCAANAGDSMTVRFLERHPYTTQTFTPMKSSACSYLVVVAPSLPSAEDHHDHEDEGRLPGSAGLPDVKGLRAFVATAAQAVTYAAGTWHAPMVALGKPGAVLDFVVSQFASGVDDEDCQLVEFESANSQEPRLSVRIPRSDRTGRLKSLSWLYSLLSA